MSYERIAGTGTNEAFVVGVDGSFRKTSVGDQLRQNVNAVHALGGKGGFLGGSRSQVVATASEVAVPDYWDVLLDWRHIDGDLTVRARVEIVTMNAATSVTARVKNITDSVNHDSSASTSTSFTEVLITIPPPGAAGVKRYRLYMLGNNATHAIGAIGAIEVYDTLF